MSRAIACSLLLASGFAAVACGADRQPTSARTVTVEVGPAAQEGDAGARDDTSAAEQAPPAVPGDESCDGATDRTTQARLREAEIAIRCLTNAVRRDRGLEPLGFDEQLARAAATRSNDMAEQNYFAHQGPDGGNVRRAVRRTGYIPDDRSWLLGENIGWAPRGRATPADLMRSWLDSPTHRANILSKDFTEMGVGAVAAVPKGGAQAGATYTQIFGVTGQAAREAQTE